MRARAVANPNQLALFAQAAEPAVVARQTGPKREKPSCRPVGPVQAGRRVDWFKVITCVVRNGYSLGSIAARLQVPKSTLIGWKQGAEPRYSEGEVLLAFWCQVAGLERAKVPTVSVADWWAYHSKA